jgi:hypothetical protein
MDNLPSESSVAPEAELIVSVFRIFLSSLRSRIRSRQMHHPTCGTPFRREVAWSNATTRFAIHRLSIRASWATPTQAEGFKGADRRIHYGFGTKSLSGRGGFTMALVMRKAA